ncbi:hypothetical protein L210DRAFT_3712828, partial [Boletus edulis BED1]
ADLSVQPAEFLSITDKIETTPYSVWDTVHTHHGCQAFTQIRYDLHDKKIKQASSYREALKINRSKKRFDIREEYYKLNAVGKQDWEPKPSGPASPSAPSTSGSAPPSPTSPGQNTAAIIGGTVCGVPVLALVIALSMCYKKHQSCRRHRITILPNRIPSSRNMDAVLPFRSLVLDLTPSDSLSFHQKIERKRPQYWRCGC